jgi:hypothetical protein
MNALSMGGGFLQNLFLCSRPGLKVTIHPNIPAAKYFDHLAPLLILVGTKSTGFLTGFMNYWSIAFKGGNLFKSPRDLNRKGIIKFALSGPLQ